MLATYQLNDSTVVYAVETKPYAASRPESLGGGTIAPRTLAELQLTWDVDHPGRTIRFHRLRNAYCAGEGLVFNENLDVLKESIAETPTRLVNQAHQELKAARSNDRVPYVPGTTLLGGKIGMSNYGHWMVEMLPRAYLSRQWLQSEMWKLLLPLVYDWMRDVIYLSLELLNIPRSCLLGGNGQPMRFEELVFIECMSRHGRYYSPVAVECMEFISQSVPSRGDEKVWISRAGERRALNDERRICGALQENGWAIMHPRELSLTDQIAACKSARHIAGVDGAGLTNLGFMRPGGSVTSFVPSNMPDIFYWHLAIHRGAAFREVRCPVVEPQDWHIPWDGPLQITPEKVLSLLEA